MLKDWRQESKKLQQKKYFESLRKGTKGNENWPHDYKRFFMLNSAEHEISMLDKSHLINLQHELLIYRKFHCFCPSNQTFKFDFAYTLKCQ